MALRVIVSRLDTSIQGFHGLNGMREDVTLMAGVAPESASADTLCDLQLNTSDALVQYISLSDADS